MRIRSLIISTFFLLSLFTTATTFTLSSNNSRHPKIPIPSHRWHAEVIRSSHIPLSASAAEDTPEDEPEFLQVESLTASQVTELIELSFFQACYALSKGEIEPLKLFIVAVKTASKKYPGASAISIAETVGSVPASVRPLEPAERDLRETWIRAIYLMMGHVLDDFDAETSDDDEVAQTYGPVLADLAAIHQSGLGLNIKRFVESRRDMLLPAGEKKKNILALEDGIEDEDFVQLSVATQTIRVLYTTLEVLSEDEDDDDDDIKQEEASSLESTSSADKKKAKKNKTNGKGFA
mmetsp:Transcript_18667/g.46216  ORF Transcript_18667/g.46216 Transcript_18667/m.46216 type:complete len:293 (-) Transcript_18667:606-1484(-)|eukprot:CAMPEP_0113624276 /NCGR_PEP_ID=MMETSP0017_2-20120614/12509_1 /TAXON_ID=2856 /ORGANISM="Cylindrotheca closterium" /LENGTH=292 /DNA_ID=CAMNT_0000534291 /DNA_START=66 /DNA_END=944 /DNA_ORIENTATION=- /assembly_acc=CAM_ASM_000147